MANRFFTDDIPDIPDNNSNNGSNNYNNYNDDDKSEKFKKIYGIVVGIVGILVFGGSLILLFNSDLIKKNKSGINDPNRANESHSLTENEDETDPSLIIPNEIKNKLDGYCELVKSDGSYVASTMNNEKDIYEMCSNYQCMTTVDDKETGITYYFKDCNASKNEYKKITKEELDISTMIDEACSNLDDGGSYSNVDVETNSSIICQNYACDLTYKGENYHKSCLT